jgi:hypothetical protein
MQIASCRGFENESVFFLVEPFQLTINGTNSSKWNPSSKGDDPATYRSWPSREPRFESIGASFVRPVPKELLSQFYVFVSI